VVRVFGLRIELPVVQSWARTIDDWLVKKHQKIPKSLSKKDCGATNN